MTRSLRFASALVPFVFAMMLVSGPDLTAQDDVWAAPFDETKKARETGSTVRVYCQVEPTNLNPITSSDSYLHGIQSYLYESLTMTDWETLETIPWIAESLPTTSADRRSYEFTIRRDVRFSDGHPVTGEDFIFFLKAVKNPYITDAAEERAYYSRISHAELIDGDPYRLRVVMTEPHALGDQCAGGLTALPKHIWDPEGIADRITFAQLNADDINENETILRFADHFQDEAKQMSPLYLIGSGPYMFAEWIRHENVTLVRNPSYWNSTHRFGKAHPDRLIWCVIESLDSAIEALKAGRIDFIPTIEKSIYSRVKKDLAATDVVPVEYDYPSYTYVGYNQRHGMFRDKRVRTALAHALDRRKMIGDVFYNLAYPVESPILHTRAEYDSTLPFIEYDLKESRRLLTEAGWSDSDGDGILDKVIDGVKTDFRFSILINNGNKRRRQIATMFTESLKKLGIKAAITSVDWPIFLDRTHTAAFDAYIGGWGMASAEEDMYQLWHSKSIGDGGQNYIGFRNARVDSLIETLRAEFDYTKRKRIYTELQRIIHDEQPYNFLVSETFAGAYRKGFRSVEFYGTRPCYNLGFWDRSETAVGVAGHEVSTGRR